ncbi:MAG: aminotransferase class V-fold PLP-dependent enzyme [Candidatus Hodarchaeota archaeon]
MTEDAIELLRQSPVISRWTFLNHAARSPPFNVSIAAFDRFLKLAEKMEHPNEEIKDTRRLFGELLGVSAEDIALIPNVASSLSIVAGIDYSAGSNVVTYMNDFPSNVYTCFNLERMKKGVTVRRVPDVDGVISPETIAEYVDAKTRLILISHVQWISGFQIDLEEIIKIAHEVDAVLALDIMQSVGMLDLDFEKYPVDIAAGGVAKWLLGPTQVGFLYVRKERLEEISSVAVGHTGAPYEGDDLSPSWDISKLNLWSDVRKFQVGSTADIVYYAARPCIKLLLNYGMDRVEKRILELRKYLVEKILDLGSKFGINSPLDVGSSGIINVKIPGDAAVAVSKLKDKNIVVSARGGGIRVAPHFYNTEEEIEKFTSSLNDIY